MGTLILLAMMATLAGADALVRRWNRRNGYDVTDQRKAEREARHAEYARIDREVDAGRVRGRW